jgi:hypothetical protein
MKQMPMVRWRLPTKLALWGGLLALLTMEAHASVEVAGWVEKDTETQAVPVQAFRVIRAGKTIEYDEAGLQPCDQLKLVDAKVVVRVTLTSNRRMRLDAHTPGRQISVPCNERGVLAKVAAALRTLTGRADVASRRVAALTRNLAVPNNGPAVTPAYVIGGKRSLYLGWVGGEGPFSVQVLNAADGREVVSQFNIHDRWVRLPMVEFAQGKYTLLLRNSAGRNFDGLREREFIAVSESALPPMPEVLKSASLSEEARTLFYADHLMGLDDRRWALEAMQRVAALPLTEIAVRQWLQRYQGRD